MKQVSFEEIGGVVATFICGDDVATGGVVKMSGNGTVADCAAGDGFCGIALGEGGDYVAVQVKGFCTVGITGVVGLGEVILVADGDGGVKVGEAGKTCLVVSVDTVAKTAIICL